MSSDLLAQYVDKRQQQGAQNASINRELAFLKRAFCIGQRCTPPKLYRIPSFPRLAEDNIRKGFLHNQQYENLLAAVPELWFRTLLELGRTYGWRVNELLGLRVKQVDLLSQTIRLEPGTTKNRDGREVTMTRAVCQLLRLCTCAKGPDDFVFTRKNGHAVRDFRRTWHKACCATGLGRMLCPKCHVEVAIQNHCSGCSETWQLEKLKYSGLLCHRLTHRHQRRDPKTGIP